MRAVDKAHLRLRSLFRRSRVEAELAAELSFHLDQQTAEYIAAGMTETEARRAALRRFGGVTQVQEQCRDARGTRLLEDLGRDLAYGVRTLKASPVFTLVAALSLALGIGANTAIFSLIQALLLRPLPVQAPEQLVAIGDPSRTGGLSEGNVRSDLMAYPIYRGIRAHNHVFSGLYASGRSGRLTVGLEGSKSEPEPARGRLVSGNYFSVLGVSAARGRTFTDDEDRAPGAAPVAVISDSFWTRRFARDPGALGKTLLLNGSPFTVIGIMPSGFTGDVVGSSTDLWVPVTMQRQVNPGRSYLERWDTSWLLLMGRLKPGVSLETARAEVNAIFARTVAANANGAIPKDLMPDPAMMKVQVTGGGAGFSPLRKQFARPLLILMGIVGLVLLVACANVANLLLERAMGRQKEIAVRLALGAGRGRLVRQLLTESLLLSLLGGALGLLFALWAGPALLRLAGGSTASFFLDLRPDLPILGFTAAAALLTGVLFGLVPAFRGTRMKLAPELKENARSLAGSGSGGRWPLARILVVCQLALSLLLLTGAGLFVRSLQNLQHLDLGLDRGHLVLVNIDPIASGYQGERIAAFPQRMLDRLKAIPGAQAVSLSENGIFSGTESSTSVRRENSRADESLGVASDRVGPGYFEAAGIPVLQGRGIGPQDRPGAARVAVVNQALAKQYFPGQDPVGRHLILTGTPETVLDIVGVAGNARDHDLRGAIEPRLYTAALQANEPLSAYNFEVRTARPETLVQPVRQAVREVDATLTMAGPQTLNGMIDDSINHERLIAKLSAVFGVLALLLASLGLYGVVSYTISRRTSEIGIRMAMGAQRAHVLWMVIRETLLLSLAGVALGIPVALLAARLIAKLLFGLSAHDPATLATSAAVLILVALFAGAIPGTRATRVDPTEALRYG